MQVASNIMALTNALSFVFTAINLCSYKYATACQRFTPRICAPVRKPVQQVACASSRSTQSFKVEPKCINIRIEAPKCPAPPVKKIIKYKRQTSSKLNSSIWHILLYPIAEQSINNSLYSSYGITNYEYKNILSNTTFRDVQLKSNIRAVESIYFSIIEITFLCPNTFWHEFNFQDLSLFRKTCKQRNFCTVFLVRQQIRLMLSHLFLQYQQQGMTEREGEYP